jgi:hypothetical protein
MAREIKYYGKEKESERHPPTPQFLTTRGTLHKRFLEGKSKSILLLSSDVRIIPCSVLYFSLYYLLWNKICLLFHKFSDFIRIKCFVLRIKKFSK